MFRTIDPIRIQYGKMKQLVLNGTNSLNICRFLSLDKKVHIWSFLKQCEKAHLWNIIKQDEKGIFGMLGFL